MKRHAAYIIITLLACLACWQLGRLSNAPHKDIIEESIDADFFNLHNEGRCLIIDSIENHLKQSFPIRNLLDSTDLFIYMNPYGCPSCRDMVFSAIKELKKNHPKFVINILISDIVNRDLFVMQKQEHDNFEFYKIKDAPLHTVYPDEEILEPVLFTLDDNLKIIHCYKTQFHNSAGLDEFLSNFVSDSFL